MINYKNKYNQLFVFNYLHDVNLTATNYFLYNSPSGKKNSIFFSIRLLKNKTRHNCFTE
jgi:hypothetical protein